MRSKTKQCKCGAEFQPYNSFQKFCSSACKFKYGPPVNLKLKPMKPIPKVSKKREPLNRIYEKVRIEVLSEAKFKCFIDGCKNVANTCEHRMGRKGYADEWARENNIPLLIDKRYLAPCCNFHNLELENNPDLSKQYQLSKIHGGKKI